MNSDLKETQDYLAHVIKQRDALLAALVSCRRLLASGDAVGDDVIEQIDEIITANSPRDGRIRRR